MDKMGRRQARLRVLSEDAQPIEMLLPLLGCSAASAIRWATRGRHGVTLDAALLSGIWYTSRGAIERFRAALAAVAPSG